MSINIAIDGPAGAGKSTIARAVAAELGFIYVDTGALYRTVALHAKRQGAETPEQIAACLNTADISLCFAEGTQHVLLCGEDVSGLIRTPEISMAASVVSALPAVRQYLFDLQLDMAKQNNVIMDGRDIGTVVLPHADLKIFLTASPQERARRRYLELSEKPDCPSMEEILEDIIKRDEADRNRAVSPLRQAEDAVLVDTTKMDQQQVIRHLLELCRERLGL
ncbi:(d)CMP kinase [Ruminococcus sp.]|uniref:(d)CMP kinase n=1 Tax=Ruminococcus sp. TaxID=41978 RepID=UPI0025FE18BE|nr:(d)CMP kinase [Ruminococcus sp.]MDD7556238.1 (d)CMP kinase [Ruminococcus sp.]MDY4963720.1 (d)CMP kinase [Ruminococcus callidus]